MSLLLGSQQQRNMFRCVRHQRDVCLMRSRDTTPHSNVIIRAGFVLQTPNRQAKKAPIQNRGLLNGPTLGLGPQVSLKAVGINQIVATAGDGHVIDRPVFSATNGVIGHHAESNLHVAASKGIEVNQ